MLLKEGDLILNFVENYNIYKYRYMYILKLIIELLRIHIP